MIAGLIAALVSTAIFVGLAVIIQPLLVAPIRYEFKVLCILMSLAGFAVSSIYFCSMVVTIWLKKSRFIA